MVDTPWTVSLGWGGKSFYSVCYYAAVISNTLEKVMIFSSSTLCGIGIHYSNLLITDTPLFRRRIFIWIHGVGKLWGGACVLRSFVWNNNKGLLQLVVYRPRGGYAVVLCFILVVSQVRCFRDLLTPIIIIGLTPSSYFLFLENSHFWKIILSPVSMFLPLLGFHAFSSVGLVSRRSALSCVFFSSDMRLRSLTWYRC